MLIDSSAWIEYLRNTGSVEAAAVRSAIANDRGHVVDTIRLELLCGAGSEAYADELARLLDRCAELDILPRQDVETAGEIFRTCRRRGETIRRPNDCLIAAVAIRHEIPVLHRDTDFDAIARHTRLQLARA